MNRYRDMMRLLSILLLMCSGSLLAATIEKVAGSRLSSEKLVHVTQQVIIDSVHLVGDNAVDGNALAKSLGITIGELISAEQSAAELVEAERRLRAVGRYREDLSFRLTRGKEFPHQILVIEVTVADPWYVGGSLKYWRDPGFVRRPEIYSADSYTASLFTGSRNWKDSGFSFDTEFLYDLTKSRETGSNSGSYGTSMHRRDDSIEKSSLSLTLAHNSLVGSGVFGAVMPRITNFNYNFSASSESFEASGKKRYEYDYEFKYKLFYVGADFYLGYRMSKFSILGGASRHFMRFYSSKNSSRWKDYSTGQTSSLVFDEWASSGSYTPQRSFVGQMAWSDKPGLTILEPGLMSTLGWTRSGGDDELEKPVVTSDLSYTWIVFENGITVNAAGEWQFLEKSPYNSAIDRSFELGLRLDHVNQNKSVIYLEAFRGVMLDRLGSSIVRSSDEYRAEVRHLSRVGLGFEYASPEFVYQISAIYGEKALTSRSDELYGTPLSSLKRVGIQ